MVIDLRSDTVTKPTKEMLEAMFHAEVGDDVFGEDPTVNKLEEMAATLFGKEAGVFCPSGTMTNQIAIKVHTQPGDEVLCDATAHIYNYEGGGISFNSGAQAKLIHAERGCMSANEVEDAINTNPDNHLCLTKLVCVENTVNRAGGSCYTLTQLQEIASVCKHHGLNYHLDGARIFNALIATNINPKAVGTLFDSVSICLSKGLGAPSGSLLLGNKDFIKKARRIRKVFGGGMRQAGYLAAAGIYALNNNTTRLKEDHRRAKIIGDFLKSLPFIESVMPVDTNIVIFKLNDKMQSNELLKQLLKHTIKALNFGKQSIRFVTHLDFNDDMLEKLLKALRSV